MHHEAKNFDIGVYFEANGHGTILFKDSVVKRFEELGKISSNQEERQAAQCLYKFSRLMNQTVGDGISDMLCIEAALAILNWKLEDWNNLYTDLPNKQVKVVVKDRSVFKTTKADTILTNPKGIQEKIDALVKSIPEGRCFVRPSGTEDCVRVYAEAKTVDLCNSLAEQVKNFL